MATLLDLPPREPAVALRVRLARTGPHAMARMRFELRWQSDFGSHTDCRVAADLNLWRDRFPPPLDDLVMDRAAGDRTSHEFAPGELVPAWRAGGQRELCPQQFDRRFGGRGAVEPRAGRFYPRGMLRGLDGVYQDDWHPFRVLGVTRERLPVDLNHPLADKALTVALDIQDIWAADPEHGGRCNDVGELLCNGGPGMQARWRDLPTDFGSDLPFLRMDPRPDADFYAKPRFVDHLDRTALSEVTGLYGRLLPKGARVLDLMSSWHSHLPADLAPARVVGLGMNAEELSANPALDQHLVQDLNQDPCLPFADGSFDAIVCTASVEYLIRPYEVFREVARVLRPGGLFVVSFSNRWFPPKAIRIWEVIHQFERMGLVGEYFLESGLFGELATWSLRGLPRPPEDKYADRLATSDPIYAIWARRR